MLIIPSLVHLDKVLDLARSAVGVRESIGGSSTNARYRGTDLVGYQIKWSCVDGFVVPVSFSGGSIHPDSRYARLSVEQRDQLINSDSDLRFFATLESKWDPNEAGKGLWQFDLYYYLHPDWFLRVGGQETSRVDFGSDPTQEFFTIAWLIAQARKKIETRRLDVHRVPGPKRPLPRSQSDAKVIWSSIAGDGGAIPRFKQGVEMARNLDRIAKPEDGGESMVSRWAKNASRHADERIDSGGELGEQLRELICPQV